MRVVLIGAAGCVGLGALWLLAMSWAMSAHGRLFPLATAETLVLLVALASLLGAIAGLGMLPFSRLRSRGAAVLALSVFVWLCFMAFGRGVYRLRERRFHEFAVRAQPLVDALYAYERVNGHPATSLGDLVPGMLPEVPRTGIGAFPEFNYYHGHELQEGGRWRLTVPVGATVFDWEHLEYRADQHDQVGRQRYGGWALIVG